MKTSKKISQLASLKVNLDGTFSGGFASLEASQLSKIKGGKKDILNIECSNTGSCTGQDNTQCSNSGQC